MAPVFLVGVVEDAVVETEFCGFFFADAGVGCLAVPVFDGDAGVGASEVYFVFLELAGVIVGDVQVDGDEEVA